jgi:hypothetical protein
MLFHAGSGRPNKVSLLCCPSSKARPEPEYDFQLYPKLASTLRLPAPGHIPSREKDRRLWRQMHRLGL